jgi:hypothetical protein
MSSDSGATWTAFNTGLNSLQVARLTDDGVYLYAGTLGGGVNRYGITTDVAEQRDRTIGISAYPVPCDGMVHHGHRTGCRLRDHRQVLDAAGRVVAEQRTGVRPAGPHQLIWNLEAVAPGLYTCRVVAGAVQGSVRVVVE